MPETNHFSLLSHRVTLAGLKQHFHLHTLLMPKPINPTDNQSSLSLFGLSQFRVCLDQGHFVFSKAKGILVQMSTYVEGAQSQLNEESYISWKSFNLIVSDEREENLMNTQ